MKPEKRFYAFNSLIKTCAIRLVIIAAIIGASTHLTENPTGLLILIAICFIALLAINDEQICIYEFHWEYNRLFACGLLVKRTKYEYKNTKAIVLVGDLNNVADKLSDEIVDRYFHELKNSIEITNSDESKKEIKTVISKTELRAFINMTNEYLKK